LSRKKTQGQDAAASAESKGATGGSRSGNGSWQKIEALREKAALKASLADVWDEDFDLDEEILAELDHTAEYFTTQTEEAEEDIPVEGDEDIDEFFDDDEV
jgi:hypothetical protein